MLPWQQVGLREDLSEEVAKEAIQEGPSSKLWQEEKNECLKNWVIILLRCQEKENKKNGYNKENPQAARMKEWKVRLDKQLAVAVKTGAAPVAMATTETSAPLSEQANNNS
jgi:hypothetical protein